MRWLLAVAALLPAAAFSADPVAGKYWYEQNCARCHGSPPQERQAGTPNITGFGADRIQNALRNVSAMAKVNLSATQVQDVAAYLVDPPRYARFPGVDYNDQWWNPQEPGWGLSLYQRPNASTTGTLLIYDQDGVPMWLLLAGLEWRWPQRLEGGLARTAGGGWPLGLPLEPAVERADGVARGFWHATGDDRVPWSWSFALAGRAHPPVRLHVAMGGGHGTLQHDPAVIAASVSFLRAHLRTP